MTTWKWLGVTLLCLAFVSPTPGRAAVADYSTIAAGTTYNAAGIPFFDGVIRFETASFIDPMALPPTFGSVDIDLSANLGFVANAVQAGNHLYPNNSSVIIDFAGSIGRQAFASILFTEGNGLVNFDVNNTVIGNVLTKNGTLEALTQNLARNGVAMVVVNLGAGVRRLEMTGPIDTIFLGGQEVIFGTLTTKATLVLAGDNNSDGFVGVDDLNIVLVNWNQNVTPGDLLAGDPSGDGFVGVDDLNTVLSNWNAGTPPGGSAIPEPGTLVLLAVSGVLLVGRSRDRR